MKVAIGITSVSAKKGWKKTRGKFRGLKKQSDLVQHHVFPNAK